MKIFIATEGELVAPRFDMANEAVIAAFYDQRLLERPRSLLISDASAEVLCDMILKEQVKTVICCGIEEEHYRFLQWKKVVVIDSVIGSWQRALNLLMVNQLQAESILS